MESPDVNKLIGALFRDHARSLVRMARFFAHDRGAAEDLVQEAFLRLHRALLRPKPIDKPVAYLRLIVLNLARDHNHRGLMSLRHRAPEHGGLPSPEDEVVMREDQREVIKALGKLPPRQRDCMLLRHFLELGTTDVAETLELSVNSVKTHLRRGMAALKTHLEEQP